MARVGVLGTSSRRRKPTMTAVGGGVAVAPATKYLDTAIGTATTPDPGPPSLQSVLIARQRGPVLAATATNHAYAAQYDTDGQRSWVASRNEVSGVLVSTATANGLGSGASSRTVTCAVPTPASDEWVGLAMDNTGTSTVLVGYRSLNGVSWIQTGTSVVTKIVPFDSTGVVRIGAFGGTGDRFDGRLYSVELRTGLDPGPTERYLDATVGTITTPDPVTMPAQYVFRMKVRGPTGGSDNTIASQYEADPQRGWLLRRNLSFGQLLWSSSLSGTAGSALTTSLNVQAVTGTDEILALAINDTTHDMVTYVGVGDGWTQKAAVNVPTQPPPFNGTSLLRIGAFTVNTQPFNGRIYWMELRTGLNPAAGTVLWRFDANEAPTDAATTTWTDARGRQWTATNPQAISGRTLWRFDASEYPGTGTAYTDPRGRTWTLTSASAIVPA